MASVSTPYPGFEYQEFHRRRQQQSSVFLTPSIFSWYQQLLQKHRVYFDAERAAWLILGYEEVQHVLSDPLTFSSQRELDPDGNNHPIDGLISLDPPRHCQVRALISKAFTPRRVAQLEGRITSLVHTLLETVAEKREMDIVDDLALPLPSRVMADLLGCSPADAGRFQQWLVAVGTLATVTTLLAKERGGPHIECQVLLYPVTDANFETPSYRECGAPGYWLTRETMRWFWDSYVPAPERQEFTVSPLRASLEQLRGLPPALIIICEQDVMRDEGEAYAHQLMASGVPVRATRYLGAIHDLALLNPIALTPAARAALAQVNDTLRTVFAHNAL